MASERRVAVCVYRGFIEPACERGLRELEAQGWEVWRRPGSAAIDRERSRLATEALDAGFDSLLWVDADQVFEGSAAQALDALNEPFASALIARRGVRDFACVFADGTEEVRLGEGGGPLEVRYVGCGFCMVRRAAFELVARYWSLPRVVDPSGAIIPFYLPMVTAIEHRGLAYLGEDYAFCERLRQAGGKILVDTRLRVGHLGSYEYGFEDVAGPARVQAGSLVLRPAPRRPS